MVDYIRKSNCYPKIKKRYCCATQNKIWKDSKGIKVPCNRKQYSYIHMVYPYRKASFFLYTSAMKIKTKTKDVCENF